jgi:adenylate cyclase
MSSFWGELKRRNVVRVAIAYVIVAWLLLQVSDTLVPALHLPEWIHSAIALMLILGLPIALLFAWAFEMTPDGIKKEAEVERDDSITRSTGRKLDNTIIAVLACAVLFFAYDKFLTTPSSDSLVAQDAQESSRMASIAILPFVNMSDDASNEYFSDGLSEELLNLLAKIPEMHVAARTSSFSFKDRPEIAVAEIARELNVAHVLEGSVRKSGDHVRITAQLIDAETGFHLWSETYDRQLEDIFATQDEIAANVTDALKVTLLGSVPSVRETDPRAYELFLQGQYVGHRADLDAYRRSIELYKQALEIDPLYAPAWAELARNYFWLSAYGGMSVDEARGKAYAAIDAALRVDPTNAKAIYVRGLVKLSFDFQVAEGHKDYERALELAPGNADVIFAVGIGLHVVGRYEETLQHMDAALKLDPLQPRLSNTKGIALWALGRYDEALESFNAVLKLSPEFPGAYRRIAGVLLAKGEGQQGLAMAHKELDEGYRLTALAEAHNHLGNTAESDAALQALIENHSDHMAAQIAEAYGYQGKVEETFMWLQRSYESRDPGTVTLLAIAQYQILHDDPRWLPFLEKIQLADAWLAMPPEHGGPQ